MEKEPGSQAQKYACKRQTRIYIIYSLFLLHEKARMVASQITPIPTSSFDVCLEVDGPLAPPFQQFQAPPLVSKAARWPFAWTQRHLCSQDVGGESDAA